MKAVRCLVTLFCVSLMSSPGGARRADAVHDSGFEDLGSALQAKRVSARSVRGGKSGTLTDLRCWGTISWPEQREWMGLTFRIYGPNNDELVSMETDASPYAVHHWDGETTVQVDASPGNTYRCRVDFIHAGNTVLIHNHYINY